MTLPQLIDCCHCDKNELSSQAIISEISQNYDDQQIISLVAKFAENIRTHHRIPGRVIETLTGIVDWSREHQSITRRQRAYAVFNIIEYWDELSISQRSLWNL